GIRGRPHRGSAVGAGGRARTASRGAAEEEAVRRVLPWPLLHLRRSGRRDAARERPPCESAARRVPGMAGRRPSRGERPKALRGAGMSGKPSSTLAFEKRWNPMLSLTREPFVDALGDVTAKPPEMERILRFNLG